MGLNDDEDDAENQIIFFLRCLVSSRVTFEMCWGCNQEVMMVVKRNENNHTENTFQFFLSISFEIYLSQDYFISCSIETSFENNSFTKWTISWKLECEIQKSCVGIFIQKQYTYYLFHGFFISFY